MLPILLDYLPLVALFTFPGKDPNASEYETGLLLCCKCVALGHWRNQNFRIVYVLTNWLKVLYPWHENKVETHDKGFGLPHGQTYIIPHPSSNTSILCWEVFSDRVMEINLNTWEAEVFVTCPSEVTLRGVARSHENILYILAKIKDWSDCIVSFHIPRRSLKCIKECKDWMAMICSDHMVPTEGSFFFMESDRTIGLGRLTVLILKARL